MATPFTGFFFRFFHQLAAITAFTMVIADPEILYFKAAPPGSGHQSGNDFTGVIGNGQKQRVDIYGLIMLVVGPKAVDNVLFVLWVRLVRHIDIHGSNILSLGNNLC
ncbi:hypothetical protein D3C79_418790 [compost metagenome]